MNVPRTFVQMKKSNYDNCFSELCSQALNETVAYCQMTVYNSSSEEGAIAWDPEKDFE